MTTTDSRTLPRNNVLRRQGDATHLIVDRDHPFFFDHPLDHIPGLLLIEGGVQFAQRAAAPGQFVNRIEARFLKYALFDTPVVLNGAATQPGETQVTLVQNGRLRATIATSTQVLTRPIAPGDQQATPELIPCDGPVLNKERAENILISTPEQSGSEISTWILPGTGDCLLTDSDATIHPLHLLESFMQMQRFLNGQRLEKGRMRDILTGVSFAQTAPVMRGGGPLRIIGTSDFTETTPGRLSRGATITCGGQEFAHCALHTALATRPIRT